MLNTAINTATHSCHVPRTLQPPIYNDTEVSEFNYKACIKISSPFILTICNYCTDICYSHLFLAYFPYFEEIK
jgi:hypothetical protein